jgi:hypothetical protein
MTLSEDAVERTKNVMALIEKQKPKRQSPRVSAAHGRPKLLDRLPCRFSNTYIQQTIDTLNQVEKLTVSEMREVIGSIPAMLQELLEIRGAKK